MTQPSTIQTKDTRILVVTAVEAEREAVLRGLSQAGAIHYDVIAGGVGPAAVAARTAAMLATAGHRYQLVISAGIGGGFPGRAAIGELVIADTIVSADLGAETPNGFLSVDELGFGTSRIDSHAKWNQKLLAQLAGAGLACALAPILTVSSATGTAATAALRERLVPGAAAEGMEGFGVAIAAAQQGVPATEVRAISNAVGPRDRSAWRIGDALKALENAFAAFASIAP
ncbi:futalosine hydrolase [Paenibacillus sp. 1011MAR3C5]|uniref:futalosine hydrolase n=1 Tax=Paenibacillus sp. 1011MAR3C5 TaxID=1675787 RepID=UPI000E6BF7AA|nr:futalosine hydrolase [Paenibacillus sp. 1011MAR3C5]RJE86066.1 futalosine hydrolase [Paenibacillus sp. 1011MAR3C5]